MKYLLDTNTCIRYLKGASQRLHERIEEIPDDDMLVCSVVKAELFFGAEKSQTVQKTRAQQTLFLSRFNSLPFDDATAHVYGRIRAQLEKRGTPVGPNDLMIAAIALANDLILITHNTSEFSRIDGLKIEDWEI